MAANAAKVPVWVVGLGSNLGDRLGQLRSAAAALGSLDDVRELGRSTVVQTPPAGGPPQPDYLNAAVAIASPLGAGELLRHGLAIERRLGRRRPDPVRWGPRTIDVDLLWSPGLVLAELCVQLPHPRLRQRPFALQPLLELVPDACDPATGEPYAALPAAQVALARFATL